MKVLKKRLAVLLTLVMVLTNLLPTMSMAEPQSTPGAGYSNLLATASNYFHFEVLSEDSASIKLEAVDNDAKLDPLYLKYATASDADIPSSELDWQPYMVVSCEGAELTVQPGEFLFFKTDEAYMSFSVDENNYYHFVTDGASKLKVGGYLATLITDDVKNVVLTSTAELKAKTFIKLFAECYALEDASELILPSENLEPYCYSEMFSGCSALDFGPELPATKLVEGVYKNMFSGCSSMKETPELPATTMATSCYAGMFQGCSSLATASNLPATELAENCYSEMFKGCSSLATASNLPATELAKNCYSEMFMGCSSLEKAPDLPAANLAVGCYKRMFDSCLQLTAAPYLPAENLVTNCYKGMFNGCTSLNYVKADFKKWYPQGQTDTTQGWLEGVSETGDFIGIYPLKYDSRNENRVPAGWNTYYNFTVNFETDEGSGRMNSDTFKIKVPDDTGYSYTLPVPGFIAQDGRHFLCWEMDSRSVDRFGALETARFTLIDDISDPHDVAFPEGGEIYFKAVWEDAELLESPSDYVHFAAVDGPIKVSLTGNFASPFSTSTSKHSRINLQYAIAAPATTHLNWLPYIVDGNIGGPEIIVAEGDAVYFRTLEDKQTFSYKDSEGNIHYYYFKIDKADNLGGMAKVGGDVTSLLHRHGKTGLYDYCFYRLFAGCERLIDASELIMPDSAIEEYCFQEMFKGCTFLQHGPELPATELAEGCYQSMFEDCSALEEAPDLPASEVEKDCYKAMFKNCMAIEFAPSLMARELKVGCYEEMFYGCKQLKEISVGFSEWNENATRNWVGGISEKDGIFMSTTTLPEESGIDKIPDGWMVVNIFMVIYSGKTGISLDIALAQLPEITLPDIKEVEDEVYNDVHFAGWSTNPLEIPANAKKPGNKYTVTDHTVFFAIYEDHTFNTEWTQGGQEGEEYHYHETTCGCVLNPKDCAGYEKCNGNGGLHCGEKDTCRVCGNEFGETCNKHDFDGTKWEHIEVGGEVYHYHPAICGHEVKAEDCPGYGLCHGGKATCTAKAVCIECKTEYGEKTKHKFSTAWTHTGEGHHYHAAICGCNIAPEDCDGYAECSGGTADCWNRAVCSKCGAEYGELATHSFAAEWSVTDGGYHYHAASCGHDIDPSECPGYGIHTGGTATHTEYAVCEDCGTSYGDLVPHEWKNLNSTQHTCDCGAVEAHHFAGNTCRDCGYVKKSSGGGSSSSGGSSGRKAPVTGAAKVLGSMTTPITEGEWHVNNGVWTFTQNNVKFENTWACIYNPYATGNQPKASWFFFDASGNMLTGWQWIKDSDGITRCYYLNPVSDNLLGALYMGPGYTPDGYFIDANGAWIVNGVVQTK